ncbi:PTS sugar transporter subunit IIA [Loigolactobacillus zhaoyuanensis]|uniref:PTS sugar transporter subunit IIA n=1 Tax=Loigolactobacillus zhaoyuanensis TaxID=2486017 RepID=UPI000F73C333|nr:PTS sugar transporter subunit IIA [Loigolactobacillus zhaoyuanensis]
MKIIVTGHGNFASGLQSTIKLLAGSIPNTMFIDFTVEMSETDLAAKFQQQIGSDNILFFCDLVGGTPYKEAAKLSFTDEEKFAVVAGCNIGSLLELGLNQSSLAQKSIKEVAEEFVKVSQSGTQFFQHRQVVQPQNDEDGI